MNSIPLLRKISDLITKPSDIEASKLKMTKEYHSPLPGLPKSPRHCNENGRQTSVDTISSDSPSIQSRGQSIAPASSYQGRKNTAPTDHLHVSLPTEMNHRHYSQPISPSSLHTDSRDESQFETSVYMSPPSTPTPQNDEDLDDLIIHRYLAEKSKVKASAVKHAALQDHVIELNRHIDEQQLEVEKERNEAQRLIQKQEQATATLELSVNELQTQLLQKQSHAETQMNAIRSEGITTLETLRRTLSEVKMEHNAAQQLLEEERKNLLKMTADFKDLEIQYCKKAAEFDKQIEQSNVLESTLVAIGNEKKAITIEHSSEIGELNNALENVNEMLSFQHEKGAELSNELKLMSCHYVKSMDKVDQLSAKSSRLTKELDTIEARLKEELQKNVLVTNQLEEMARGFIDADEMLEEKKSTVKNLSSMLADLRDELVDEKSKAEQLAGDLKDANHSLTESSDEVLKLSSLTTSLNTELGTVKKTLSKALHKVKSLANKLKESDEKCSNAEKLVKTEQESVEMLTTRLQESTVLYSTVSNDLTKTKAEVEEGKIQVSELSVLFDEKEQSIAKISALLEKERSISESTKKGNVDRIAVLSDEISALKKEHIAQGQKLALRESNQSDLQEHGTRLEKELKEEVEKSSDEKSKREDLEEKLIFQEDSVASLTCELTSLEQKHTVLFGNLVETESKFQHAKESLDESSSQLNRKDTELKDFQNMFNQEMMEKDMRLEQEKENARNCSTQLLDKNKKCKSMYSNLVSLEEKLLKKEEASQHLTQRLSDKEKECKMLILSIEREKDGPLQRKLRVAKNMIKAEKDRHQAILKEVEAKNIIISRIEKKSQTCLDELERTTKEMQEEKEKKATHSARALQDLHSQLDDERKQIRKEKEELRAMLQSEKSTVKSLTMRISALEGSNEKGAEVSQALKKEHEGIEQVRKLTTQNKKLMGDVGKYRQIEEDMKSKHVFMEGKIIELIDSMDKMAQFCGSLEGEKNNLKAQLESARNLDISSHSSIENSRDDECTLGSLSEFSLAQTPAPRQTQWEILMKRTRISKKVNEEDEDIELTVDARHLYDE